MDSFRAESADDPNEICSGLDPSERGEGVN